MSRTAHITHRLTSIYQNLVIQRPKLVLLIVAALAILMALGLPNFKLDASSDSLTLQHDSDLDFFRAMNQRYQSGDFLVITFKPKVDLFSDSALDTMSQLTAELADVPGVVSTLSMLDAPLLYSPKISLNEINEPRTLKTQGVDRDAAKQEFLNSPIYREMLLGPDGQTTAILLNLRVNEKFIELVRERDAMRLKRDKEGLSDTETVELERISQEFLDYRTQLAEEDHARVQRVRDIVDRYQDRAVLFVGGATMITADMIDFIKSDLKVFGSGVLLFMILIMAIIFRQKRFVILPILTCVTSVLMMLGFLSWIDWRLTVISSNFVSLLLIISLAITIHLLVRYREYHAAEPDLSQADLVMKTVRFMAKPCLYTTLTTMVAFVSLVVSDIRPVIDFGWMMTIGLGVSLVLCFVMIPAGLMLLPKGEPKDKGDHSAAFTTRFSRFTEKHSHWVLILSVLVGILSFLGIKQLEVENRFIDYFHKSTEIYQGMSVIDKNLGGTISLDIVLDAPASKAVGSQDDSAAGDTFGVDDEFGVDPFAEDDAYASTDPFGMGDPFSEEAAEDGPSSSYWYTMAGISDIRALHDYLDSLPEVGKVQSLATFYQVASDVNNAPLNDFELALIRNALPASIGDILINPYLADEANQTRISLRVKETDPNLHRAELLEKIKRTAIDDLGFEPDQFRMTGLLVLYNNMLQSLYKSQIVTLGAVFLGILIMFLVLFRSLSLALISIAPNLLAAGTVLGGMGWAGVPLDMMTITIAAITVGIGVDDTIHYIHRFKAEFAKDGDYVASMHRSHASIGRAMFYTSSIIVIGFSILALSRFIPTIYFGVLTGFAMLAAILAALTLLPRLILLVKPLGPSKVSF